MHGYGWGHLLLACYAALPAVLTADLLHKLRLNFGRYTWADEQRVIHAVAVNDLLLSALCRETSFERFEMDLPVRYYLQWLMQESQVFATAGIAPTLHVLQSDGKNAPQPLESVARFLFQYAAAHYRTEDPVTTALREVQQLSALAYLEPHTAARQVAQKLAESGKPTEYFYWSNQAVRLEDQYERRLNAAASSERPEGFDRLIQYSRVLQAHLTGTVGTTEDWLRAAENMTVGVSGAGLPGPGDGEGVIRLPVPRQVGVQLAERTAAYYTQKKEERIRACAASRSSRLDLSYCRLTEIPAEIFEFDWLEELILDNNRIETIPREVLKLVHLRILSMKNNLSLKEPFAKQAERDNFLVWLRKFFGTNVFISHGSKDDAFALALRQALELSGVSVLVDSRELLQSDILQDIKQAITGSDYVLLIVSAYTFQSRWVKQELDYAKSAGKRIITLLLDEQSPHAVAWLFDEEPLSIPVSTAPGGLQKALPALLAALDLTLPEDAEAVYQAPEPPVSELLLVLENPVLYTEGGVRRGSARAHLEYHPADGGSVRSGSFGFISPLGPDVADRIRWYVEEFPRYPFVEKILHRAEEIAAQLPLWGKALFDAISTDDERRALLLEWKDDRHHERRFSVELDAAEPAGLSEEEKAVFFEATSLLLSTPWEILHDGQDYLFQGQQPVRVRRMQPNRTKKSPLPPQDTLRILLVVPRPEDKQAGLIDHRAATRALLQAVEALGDLAELTILETPTFPALSRKIGEAAKAGRPFSVVHFDGHGVFDQYKGMGALCFESAEAKEQAKLQGRATAIVYAQDLAFELNKLRIPLFFLDAPQTAQTDNDPTASVATTLLENGVASVVAMSYDILVTASEKFTAAFYRKLAEGSLIGAAMLAGQQALHDDAVRAHLPGGESLRLQDWFVPVLFQEQKDPQLVRQVPGAQVRRHLAEAWKARLGAMPAEPPHGFVGRDRELLALERLLQKERYAVLIGQGGAGKTTLATELARWLLRTRRFGRLAFVSFGTLRDARSAIDALGKQLDSPDFSVATFENEEAAMLVLDRRLQEYATLIVLDNLDSVLPEPGGDPIPGVAPEEELTGFFTRLLQAEPRTRLLLTARETLPEPFNLDERAVRIGALAPYDALRLIAQVITHEGISVPSLHVEDLDKQFGALARTANYHARALTLLAKTLAERGGALTELNADLSQLMAELEARHPGERENSLYASLELSLRRLPEAMRPVVDALTVYHGGADLATWAMVAAVEQEEVARAAMALVEVGLAELALDKFPYYFKIDPALPAYLASQITAKEAEALLQRWLDGMMALSRFLYEQLFKDAQLSSDLCLLAEDNLIAMLSNLPQRVGAEQLINEAQEIEALYANLGRTQMVKFAQTIREQAAQTIGEWNHAQFIHKSATADRYLEQGDLNAAFQLAREVWEQSERAGRQAYPGADYDGAMAIFRLGRVLEMGGQSEQALSFLTQARQRFLAIAQGGETNAENMAAVCLTEMGDCFGDLGRYDEAAEHYLMAIKLNEKTGNLREIAVGKGQLASIRMRQKNYAEALELYQEVKIIFEKLREPRQVSVVWHQIGRVHHESGNYAAAEKAYQESLAINIREKNIEGEARTIGQLGNLYKGMGRLEDAMRMFERSADIFASLGNLHGEGTSRNNMAGTLIELHRMSEARTQLLRAIECNLNIGHAAEPWKTWAILFELETSEGNHKAANEALQKAMLAYAAYRKDGGESQSNRFQMISAAAQALQSGTTGELLQQLETLNAQTIPADVNALLLALSALLQGSRDPALTDNPDLYYMDAVDLKLLFFPGDDMSGYSSAGGLQTSGRIKLEEPIVSAGGIKTGEQSESIDLTQDLTSNVTNIRTEPESEITIEKAGGASRSLIDQLLKSLGLKK